MASPYIKLSQHEVDVNALVDVIDLIWDTLSEKKQKAIIDILKDNEVDYEEN